MKNLITILHTFSLMIIFTLFSFTQTHAADNYDANLIVTASPSIIVNAGSEVTYNVTIEASRKITGPIVVTNTFDAAFSYISNTNTDWSCVKTGQNVICTYSQSINNNTSSDFTFTIIPTANGTTRSITNDTNITSVGNVSPDTDPSNNQASTKIEVNPIADLAVTIIDSKDPVVSNEIFNYKINVTNHGPYEAEVVKVNDFLPSSLIYFGGTGTNWSCTLAGGVVSCLYSGNLASGASTNDLLIYAQAPSAIGTVSNNVKVSAFTTDQNKTNNTATETTEVISSATNLSIALSASPDPVSTSSTLTYTIDVANNGPLDATNVNVSDALPSNVQFASVDGGNDWSCSQGFNISCNFIGNSGLFTQGASVDPIVIKVTTPPTDDVVVNTVDVASGVGETDSTDNNATVSVQVQFNSNIIDGERTFEKYLQYNVFGDMKHIGNANVNKRPGDSDQDYNDLVYMQYIDTDADPSTYNSSSSTLYLDNNYTVVWAGLYWEGHLCQSSNNGQCVYSNSTLTDYNDGRNHMAQIKLSTPTHPGYVTITANNLDNIQENNNGALVETSFSGFADVTDFVTAAGTYTIADIPLSEGKVSYGGNYGGWMMLVIYEDESKQLHYKNISVFNGLKYVNADNFIFDIDGFVTPINGAITASIAFFAGDGDPSEGGVAKMRQGTSSTYGDVGGDASNPTDNLLNSTIAEFGTPINPGITKTYGVDADRVDVSSFMVNGQTDTKFKFNVSTPSGGVDYYTLSMFAFATDLTTPIINNFDKSAEIVDLNGTIRPASAGTPIYAGSELIYTLTFKNTGDEAAYQAEIFDDFDFDGLSNVFDLPNFDGSKIKLSLPNSTTWQSNPNCGFDASDSRVWCKVNTIGVGDEYKMQFSVRINSDLGEYADTNTTNTAYINYKNLTTNENMILVSNEHGDFGGASNAFDAGTLTAITYSYTTRNMDATNENYPYDKDKNITTKIVNKNFNLNLVYLDGSGNNINYTGNFNMPVVLTLANRNDISLKPNYTQADPAPEFVNGMSELVATNLSIPIATKRDWVQMSFINWNELGWSESDINCVLFSTTGGNFKGLPQCLSADSKIRALFAPEIEKNPFIANTCLGDQLVLQGGQVSACDASAYSAWSLNSAKTIMPEKYRHIYGCYQCLADGIGSTVRSTDDFAARPDKFILTATDTDFPDLLRAGSEYNVTMKAIDGFTNQSFDYNQSKSNLDLNQTLYFADNTADTTGTLHGAVRFAPRDFNITSGISTIAGIASNEVVGLSFNDVGFVQIFMQDQKWSDTDSDDTPQDCNTTTVTIDGQNIAIEGPAYICGELNATFIPHHFNVNNIQLHNHADGSLTYLSSDLNMSAAASVDIAAMTEDNNITENFSQGALYYENPVTVNMNISHNHPLNNTKLIHDIPNPTKIGFARDINVTIDGNITQDQSGTRTIRWDESNITTKLMFNYHRNINEVVNPFNVQGSEANITVKSTYTGSAPSSPAVISGVNSGKPDNNVTFYYARVRPFKDFYQDIITTWVETPVAVDVYCDLGFTACNNLGIDTVNAQIDDSNWWLSLNHNINTQDGNVTITEVNPPIEGSGNWDIGPGTAITQELNLTNGSDTDINVTRDASGVTLPLTVQIDIDNTLGATDSWMIYNPDDPILLPTPFYKVRFIGSQAGWTGVGDTGHVLENNASHINTKRMNW